MCHEKDKWEDAERDRDVGKFYLLRKYNFLRF